jgi:hypothetical protein
MYRVMMLPLVHMDDSGELGGVIAIDYPHGCKGQPQHDVYDRRQGDRQTPRLLR